MNHADNCVCKTCDPDNWLRNDMDKRLYLSVLSHGDYERRQGKTGRLNAKGMPALSTGMWDAYQARARWNRLDEPSLGESLHIACLAEADAAEMPLPIGA